MKKYIKWIFRVLTFILAIILIIYSSWLIFNDIGIFKFICAVVIGVSLAFILGGVMWFFDWVWSDD